MTGSKDLTRRGDMHLIERSTWGDEIATNASKPFIRNGGFTMALAVGDYPEEPDLIVTFEGGDGMPEFVDWLRAHINAPDDPVRLLAELVKARNEDCPCCPSGSDEQWERAEKLVANVVASLPDLTGEK
jgi:hypothetical protein